MNKLQRGTKILTALRDAYVERIMEFVIENEEDLMEHARGEHPYCNTDELTNFGELLRQASVILGNLPSPQPQEPQQQQQRPQRDDQEHAVGEPISFAMWAEQIRAGNLHNAVVCLSYLFQIDMHAAAHCTQQFVYKLQHEPGAFGRVNQLRVELRNNPANALVLLGEYFGLSGLIDAHILTHLQTTV